jgi:glycosyltransferase involved in cell wall biosynthesis
MLLPPPKIAILHVALEPTSGVWSVMRDVALAQVKSGRYCEVAMGIIASTKWPSVYANALDNQGIPHCIFNTFNIFGTAQFLLQMIRRPPLGAWADDLIKRARADRVIVHIHNAWLSGVFLPVKGGDDNRIQVVVTFHGVCSDLVSRPVRRWLHRQMAQRLIRYGARLTSVDTGSLHLAEQIFGISADRFFIVPNGVAEDTSLNAARWTGNGQFVLGYVGLLAGHKGWSIIAGAVLKIRESGRNIRLLVAGTGPDEAAVKQLAADYPESIEFVGYVTDPRKNVMPRLHALSLMSTYEGLPMVLIEAASIGLPIIATATGGVREILQDGVNGIVVQREMKELVCAIERLYDRPETLLMMSKAARSIHVEQFEISKIADLYHSVY